LLAGPAARALSSLARVGAGLKARPYGLPPLQRLRFSPRVDHTAEALGAVVPVGHHRLARAGTITPPDGALDRLVLRHRHRHADLERSDIHPVVAIGL